MLEKKVMEWKKTNDPKLFKEIFEEFRPLIYKHMRRFTGSGLLNEHLELQARKIMADALKKYTPTKGNLAGYVNSYLQGLSRFVNTYQSPLRLPENYNLAYHTFETTRHELMSRLGREPSAIELADELGWPVEKVMVFLRRQIVHDDPGHWNKVIDASSLKIKEARAYLASRYGADAEKLFALVEGLDEPKKSLQQAAREVNIEYNTARRLYKKMKEEFHQFLS